MSSFDMNSLNKLESKTLETALESVNVINAAIAASGDVSQKDKTTENADGREAKDAATSRPIREQDSAAAGVSASEQQSHSSISACPISLGQSLLKTRFGECSSPSIQFNYVFAGSLAVKVSKCEQIHASPLQASHESAVEKSIDNSTSAKIDCSENGERQKESNHVGDSGQISQCIDKDVKAKETRETEKLVGVIDQNLNPDKNAISDKATNQQEHTDNIDKDTDKNTDNENATPNNADKSPKSHLQNEKAELMDNLSKMPPQILQSTPVEPQPNLNRNITIESEDNDSTIDPFDYQEIPLDIESEPHDHISLEQEIANAEKDALTKTAKSQTSIRSLNEISNVTQSDKEKPIDKVTDKQHEDNFAVHANTNIQKHEADPRDETKNTDKTDKLISEQIAQEYTKQSEESPSTQEIQLGQTNFLVIVDKAKEVEGKNILSTPASAVFLPENNDKDAMSDKANVSIHEARQAELVGDNGVTSQLTNEQLISESGTNKQLINNLKSDKPMIRELAADKPMISELAADKPMISELATDKPMISKSVTDKQVINEPPTDKQVIRKLEPDNDASSELFYDAADDLPSTKKDQKSTVQYLDQPITSVIAIITTQLSASIAPQKSDQEPFSQQLPIQKPADFSMQHNLIKASIPIFDILKTTTDNALLFGKSKSPIEDPEEESIFSQIDIPIDNRTSAISTQTASADSDEIVALAKSAPEVETEKDAEDEIISYHSMSTAANPRGDTPADKQLSEKETAPSTREETCTHQESMAADEEPREIIASECYQWQKSEATENDKTVDGENATNEEEAYNREAGDTVQNTVSNDIEYQTAAKNGLSDNLAENSRVEGEEMPERKSEIIDQASTVQDTVLTVSVVNAENAKNQNPDRQSKAVQQMENQQLSSKDYDRDIRKRVNKVLKQFNPTDNNCISADKVGCVLRFLNLNPTEADIKDMTRQLSPENGEVNVDAFSYLATEALKSGKYAPIPKEEMLEAFAVFDKKSIGLIGVEKLRHILTTFGEPLTENEFAKFLVFSQSGVYNGFVDYYKCVKELCVDQ